MKNKLQVSGSRRATEGIRALCKTVSLYPSEWALVARRVRELGIKRSEVFRILCQVEEREALVRREVIARVKASKLGMALPPETTI